MQSSYIWMKTKDPERPVIIHWLRLPDAFSYLRGSLLMKFQREQERG